MDRVCAIAYGNGMAHVTTGRSLFEVAARAIEWAEVSCQSFGTARRIPDDEILEVRVVGGDDDVYQVRAGRVCEWLRQQQAG